MPLWELPVVLGVLLHYVMKQVLLNRLSRRADSLGVCYLGRGLDCEVLVHLVRDDLDDVLS